MYTCIDTYVHINAYMHTCLPAYIHTNIHAYMCIHDTEMHACISVPCKHTHVGILEAHQH